MASKLLTERFALSAGKVDRTDPERPVVRGVLLCGAISQNRRRYLRKAFEGNRVERYNGVPVRVTLRHTDPNVLYHEQIGVIENARVREEDGMPLGDIAVNPHKQHAEAFLWDAQHQPKACGMSHVANCDSTRAADGWEDVTEMIKAEAVDVIGAGHAATTRGLYESIEGRTVPFTRKQLVEWMTRQPESTNKQITLTKWLAEEMGDDGMALDAPPVEGAKAGDTLTDAFITAATDEMRECMAAGGDKAKIKACLGKLKKMLNAHADIKAEDGAGGGDDDDDDDDDDTDTVPTEARTVPLKDIVAECKAAKLDNPPVELIERLTRIADKDTRAFVIESVAKPKGAGGTRPAGETRRPGAGGAGAIKTEQTNAGAGANQPTKIPKFDEL